MAEEGERPNPQWVMLEQALAQMESTRTPRQWCDCGAPAENWVKEDERPPRPICGRCLARLQHAMAFGERARLEALAAVERRKKHKAERDARRASRRR